jgi:hypothetical protein
MKCAFGVTGEVRMTECDHMLTELEEKAAKWQSARAAAEKAGASERDTADFKIMDAEYLGLQQRVRKCIEEDGSAYDKERLERLIHKGG